MFLPLPNLHQSPLHKWQSQNMEGLLSCTVLRTLRGSATKAPAELLQLWELWKGFGTAQECPG